MKKAKAELLNSRHGVTGFRFFRQKTFRTTYLPQINADLCSALVGSWANTLADHQDWFESAADPNEAFINEIKSLFIKSVYVSPEALASVETLTDMDKALLMKKYGAAEPGTITELMDQHGVKDLVQLDLSLLLNRKLMGLEHFTLPDEAFWQSINGHAPKATLAILRINYVSKPRSTTKLPSAGHRVAIHFSAAGSIRFFDPNLGQVDFAKSATWQTWVKDYWQKAGYASKAGLNTHLYWFG